MPELASHKNENSNDLWSKHHSDDASYNRLEKFWGELSNEARKKLLQIDKQTLFEHARKKMYCSRCNGLLLEGFSQIVMYGKSWGGGDGNLPSNRPSGAAKYIQMERGSWNVSNGCQDGVQDPSVHPWGGLTATRDGSLTLLDCYLRGKSLKGLQKVFDSARGREQERELLYPDACGGEGRGWISQGIAGYGRGHGTREACALHTARLSCDALVDFWSALGEETQQSLFRMKEEDFIERLLHRFDSKRFCRDCRRNVIHEFKELKELKRLRHKPRCTSWFCVADSAFQYEVSDDTVEADWCQSFPESYGTYDYFEWAVGTGEGKSDIVGFENVGMSKSVKVSGLDLDGLSACFITLKAWRMDGRCTELCVKAHALKGRQCVHRRLVVVDGFVSINRGESIRNFFEHAEEAEEEDDDAIDKDGDSLDGGCSRPQKHAKSPELAREFLLDAATVIFKEQVEKAFREGTARQNARSIFVCLALKLLEGRVHVACKEIITLEKQMKLLEEEEKEKHEEEERNERKRKKEREKKLRRKERSKGKDDDKEKQLPESNENLVLPHISQDVVSQKVDEECTSAISSVDSLSETGELSMPKSPDIRDKRFSLMQKDSCENTNWEGKGGGRVSFTTESRFSHPKKNFWRDFQLNSSVNRRSCAVVAESGFAAYRSESRNHGVNFRACNISNRQSRMNGRVIFYDKLHCPNNKMNESHSCSCHQKSEYRVKVDIHVSAARGNRESRSGSSLDMTKQVYQGNRHCQMDKHEGYGRPKGKSGSLNSFGRDKLNYKKVWEPLESQKRYLRPSSDANVMLTPSPFNIDGVEPVIDPKVNQSPDDSSSREVTGNSYEEDQEEKDKKDGSSYEDDWEEKDKKEANISSVVTNGNCQSGGHVGVKEVTGSSYEDDQKEKDKNESKISSVVTNGHFQSGGHVEVKGLCFASETVYVEVSSCPVENCISSSDNCSSCLSEGDSSPSSSNLGTLESSITADLEDGRHQMEGSEVLQYTKNVFSNGDEVDIPDRDANRKQCDFPKAGNGLHFRDVEPDHRVTSMAMHNNLQAPFTMSHRHHNPLSWPAVPTNGYVPYSTDNQHLYARYDSVQHSATPSFNSEPRFDLEGNMKASAVEELVTETNLEVTTPALAEKPVNGGGERVNFAKLQAKSSNFSLFHFGGPVEFSKCCKSEFFGVGEFFSSKISNDQVENDPSDNKVSRMEEYNLFATGNGISFSIF